MREVIQCHAVITLSVLTKLTLPLANVYSPHPHRPWAVWQWKRLALGHSNVHGESGYCLWWVSSTSAAYQLHLIDLVLRPSSHECIPCFLYRMTHPPSNKSIVHSQFYATFLPSWTPKTGSTIIHQWLPCLKRRRRSINTPWPLDCPARRYVSLWSPTILVCTGRSLVPSQHCTPNP